MDNLQRLRNIHCISQNGLELGGITILIYSTLLLNLFVSHQFLLFICLISFGICVFEISTFDQMRGNAVIYIFAPWYFWMVISFGYLVLDEVSSIYIFPTILILIFVGI